MLYYVAEWLMGYVSAFNVFTYITVRSGAAAVTAFTASLLLGPAVIRWLQMLKVGQYIREDHVEDLHALHKSKAGTPTMGGALILLSTIIALALWANFANRLLIVAVAVLCLLGGIGFLDDFIKVRRKHNLGLTAKAKALGQVIVGFALGIYLLYNPITVSATIVTQRDVTNWRQFVADLEEKGEAADSSLAKTFWEALPSDQRTGMKENPLEIAWSEEARDELRQAINGVLEERALFDAETLASADLTAEGLQLAGRGMANLTEREALRLNRLMLESAFPTSILATTPDLHTKVEVPGLRWVLIPMGVGYALFVMIIIFSSSNAVNLTDGLDGLAIGASIMSLLAYTAIAYAVSRADWSRYLFLIHVPEASELTVFGAALLGAGLGFLWFNSHPAEVFMGDTGSLALGGAIGAMAALTKQELLLVVVGGLFVLEGMSVVIQVASFKLRGKRVFKMAPLHHHFELLGWSETKVTIRFWIMALIFALMSLGTLKLR